MFCEVNFAGDTCVKFKVEVIISCSSLVIRISVVLRWLVDGSDSIVLKIIIWQFFWYS